MSRSLSSRSALAIGLILGLLTACSFFPRPVGGLPAGPPWFSLPLSQWLAEGRAEPEAMAACDSCGAGLVAGVVRLSGDEAREAEALLRNPERLVRALKAMPGRDERARGAGKAAPAKITASARSLEVGSHTGFLLGLSRADGRHPVYGAVLGQRLGEGLTIVLVIGGDVQAVEETAQRVAVENLGS